MIPHQTKGKDEAFPIRPGVPTFSACIFQWSTAWSTITGLGKNHASPKDGSCSFFAFSIFSCSPSVSPGRLSMNSHPLLRKL